MCFFIVERSLFRLGFTPTKIKHPTKRFCGRLLRGKDYYVHIVISYTMDSKKLLTNKQKSDRIRDEIFKELLQDNKKNKRVKCNP